MTRGKQGRWTTYFAFHSFEGARLAIGLVVETKDGTGKGGGWEGDDEGLLSIEKSDL